MVLDSNLNINFVINNDPESSIIYFYSKKAGIYSVVFDSKVINSSVKHRLEKKVNSQKKEVINLCLSNYVNMKPQQQKILLAYKKEEDSALQKIDYMAGMRFEFDCFAGGNKYIFSKDYGKKYWLNFLAGFIDSCKSYNIRIEDFGLKSLNSLFSILNYLEFKYKEVDIDSKYLTILTKNPFCLLTVV